MAVPPKSTPATTSTVLSSSLRFSIRHSLAELGTPGAGSRSGRPRKFEALIRGPLGARKAAPKKMEEQPGSAAPPCFCIDWRTLVLRSSARIPVRRSAAAAARSTLVEVDSPGTGAGIRSTDAVARGRRDVRRQAVPDLLFRGVGVIQVALVGRVFEALARPVSAALRGPYGGAHAFGAELDHLRVF